MKPNKEIKKKLIQGASRNKIAFEIEFDDYIKAIKAARSVEKIMVAKQLLLVKMIKSLPLGTSNCYFCLLNSPTHLVLKGCKTCKWGKVHEICCISNSDYSKIQNLCLDLQGAIEELYYKGERYR